MKLLVTLFLFRVTVCAAVIPRPQFQRIGADAVDLRSVRIALKGNSRAGRLARDWLQQELRAQGTRLSADATTRIELIETSDPTGDGDDRSILAEYPEQGYVLDITAGSPILIQAVSGQGLLYGVATFLQLVRQQGGLRVIATHIRDYPDFRYRAAADWLLLGEINRWGYDWGDGRNAFLARIRRKLDFCLRYKINMVFFDGFGWGLERTTGYSAMMREINHYARDRGIKLIFGGYGYYNMPEYLRADRGIGIEMLNRQWYPDGPVYFCMPGERLPRRGQEVAVRTHGTCRSNDEMLRIRTKELTEFVRSVEPGALYIHHEDLGDFDATQNAWLFRCEACRRRWPSDKLIAADGGAGAIAHGYKALLAAIRSSKNSDTGYDAARDCTVILISPVYRLNEKSAADWNHVLDFWTLIASRLPRDPNLEFGFREIFPSSTGQRWMDAFASRMASVGIDARTFVFLLGGSQGYENRYPLTATAALNGHYLGAEAIYNFSGSAHQEALQVLNAMYGWNSKTEGAVAPTDPAEIRRAWTELVAGRIPPEISRGGGVLDDILAELYGPKAASHMKGYLSLSEPRPGGRANFGQPTVVAPLPVFFDVLERDRTTWNSTDSALHRNLRDAWLVQARVNRSAVALVEGALRAGPKATAWQDLTELVKRLEVGSRFSLLLANWHRFLAGDLAEVGAIREQIAALETHLKATFQFDTVCPLGGDDASWLETLRALRSRLNEMQQ